MQHVRSTVHGSAPSYVKRPKQPFVAGAYRPLIEDHGTLSPADFKTRRRAALYTHKASLCATPVRKSIYTPAVPVSSSHVSANIFAITKAQGDSTSVDSAPSDGKRALQTVTHTVKATGAALATAGRGLSHAARATAKAVKSAAHVVHNTATKVRNAWHTFTSLKAVQPIIKFFQRVHALWKKRMKFSYAFYTIVFFLLTSAEVIFLQWGMYSEPKYAKGTKIDETTKILQSVSGKTTQFICQMWLENRYNFLFNLFALTIIYLAFIFITNRFWIATALFGVLFTAYGVANHIKMQLRNEPIIPADLTFVAGGNSDKLLSFIPKENQQFVNSSISVVIWLACLCALFFIIDGRRQFIPCSWRHPFSNPGILIGSLTRIFAAITCIGIVCSYSFNLSIPGSWAYSFAGNLGYTPSLFDATLDAKTNGPATTFLSLTKTKVMDKPENYNRKTMDKIAQKYDSMAHSINANRKYNITESTVIMILSETFSDPTRVPNISFSTDPIPNIHQIEENTTSGLMLSSGYGGGTANMEYQALTGLNLTNFDDSLIIPFQQLVPNQKAPYAFNQIWNTRYGTSGSDAVHPYYQNMYLRNTDYRKFGFAHLRTLDSKPKITHKQTSDYNPYVTDEAAYQNVLDLVNNETHPQFLQLSTMQNHMPYTGWYPDNEFTEADSSVDISTEEHQNLETYVKGLSLTDQATASFLNQLNLIDKPVTVIFYGDHLPSIYSTAEQDPKNSSVLHETDYFIWSNSASPSNGTKLADTDAAYISPNYFMALAASHMNAKVSPYLALLTMLHNNLPASSRVAFATGGVSSGDETNLDQVGNQISKKALSKETKQLLLDYRLVQYDMTAGKGYLADTNFTKIK